MLMSPCNSGIRPPAMATSGSTVVTACGAFFACANGQHNNKAAVSACSFKRILQTRSSVQSDAVLARRVAMTDGRGGHASGAFCGHPHCVCAWLRGSAKGGHDSRQGACRQGECDEYPPAAINSAFPLPDRAHAPANSQRLHHRRARLGCQWLPRQSSSAICNPSTGRACRQCGESGG